VRVRVLETGMQILIYFLVQRIDGASKGTALRSFLSSPLCRSLGDRLTVGDVWEWLDFAYVGDSP
jgi:hypothetical protein